MRRPVGRVISIALLGVVIAASLTTGALGYWSANGTGSATTVLSNLQSLSFEPGTASAQLYPGGAATVSTIAKNPNPFSVAVESLVADNSGPGASFEVDTGHTDCDVSVLSFAAQNNGGKGWLVPPRVGTTDGSLAIEMPTALDMSAGAANACQGAMFTVFLKAGPR